MRLSYFMVKKKAPTRQGGEWGLREPLNPLG